MTAVHLVWAWANAQLATQRDRLRGPDGERGDIVVTIVVTAGLVTIALVILAILRDKAVDTANSIKTE
jgi:hypothetical protein